MKIKEILQTPLTIVSDVDDDTKEVFYGTIGDFIKQQLEGYDVAFFSSDEDDFQSIVVRYGSSWDHLRE